ncbi:hypothetical protein J699_01085 [Acinetobacter sp. 1000160]|nr:hypothetical protein J522_0311 [Acinetobacter baumannii 146457]EYT22662.1 hypothetical protein J699_01085 [Acinetobacter sp. 1000160]
MLVLQQHEQEKLTNSIFLENLIASSIPNNPVKIFLILF